MADTYPFAFVSTRLVLQESSVHTVSVVGQLIQRLDKITQVPELQQQLLVHCMTILDKWPVSEMCQHTELKVYKPSACLSQLFTSVMHWQSR